MVFPLVVRAAAALRDNDNDSHFQIYHQMVEMRIIINKGSQVFCQNGSWKDAEGETDARSLSAPLWHPFGGRTPTRQ